MNGNFALVWDKMLRSSLWVKESKETRLLWITLLMMKDRDGCIYGSVVGLADAAKISADECRASLKVLLSPDPDDTSKVMDGRRILEIKGGWKVVNHEAYRFSTESRRQYWRDQKAKTRAKKKGGSKREERFEEAYGDGDMSAADGFSDAIHDAPIKPATA